MEEEFKNIEKNKNRKFVIGNSKNIDSKEILQEKVVKLPLDKFPIIVAGGSFNTQGRETKIDDRALGILKSLIQNIDTNKAYFIIGHKMEGYEKAVLDIAKELNKDVEIDAIIPRKVNKNVAKNLLDNEVNGVCISTEQEELGIYKSFNYEIFERIPSIVLAFDGNSPVSNLVQEAKNGKAKAKIYINNNVEALKEKADSLDGYVTEFNLNNKEVLDNILDKIHNDNPEMFLKIS